MWNIIKTITTLELIWPSCTTTGSVCRILERLDEGAVQYWEPFWSSENEELGIRFASEGDVIEALPGTVVRFEGGHAVSKRKTTAREYDPTTTIGEKKCAVAYVYDIGRLTDLKALSESGHRVVFVDGRVLVGADSTEFAGCWVVEDVATQRLHAEHGATSLEEIAEDYDGELVKGRKEN